MIGGMFLVWLKEVLNSEKNCFNKNLAKRKLANDISNVNIDNMEVIKQHVAAMGNEIQETVLSKESE